MRYLFVTVDGAGALHPQVALAQRMAARGHQVRFLACRSQQAAIGRAGLLVHTYPGEPDFDMADPERSINDWEYDDARVFEKICQLIWFGPTHAVADAVLAEAQREPTDVLVVDHFAFGAAIAGEHLGLPMAVLWHTVYSEPARWNDAGLQTINAKRRELGLAPDPTVFGAYRRAARILSLTTEQFGADAEAPGNLMFVGPQLPPGREPAAPNQHDPATTPSVLVSLGTSYQAQQPLLTRVIEALGALPVHGLVTTGHAVGFDGAAPGNVEIVPWLAHSEVLGDMDLVITHAGLGSLMNALAFGVPVLCLPLGRDQHFNAERVTDMGFGAIADASADVASLKQAIADALARTALRTGARELAELGIGRFDTAAIALEAIPDS